MESPVMFESAEVVDQRVRDLTMYLKNNLPEMFNATGDTATIKSSNMKVVLMELEDEFGTNPHHRMALAVHIGNTVSDLMNTVIDRQLEIKSKKAHIEDPEFEGWRGTLDVDWLSIAPIFGGELGVLRDVAGLLVISTLNNHQWDDPSWLNMFIRMSSTLGPFTEYMYGMYGFLLLYIYIEVLNDNYPSIEFIDKDPLPPSGEDD